MKKKLALVVTPFILYAVVLFCIGLVSSVNPTPRIVYGQIIPGTGTVTATGVASAITGPTGIVVKNGSTVTSTTNVIQASNFTSTTATILTGTVPSLVSTTGSITTLGASVFTSTTNNLVNASISGTQTTTGNAVFRAALTTSGNITGSANLAITGTSTLNGAVTFNGTIDTPLTSNSIPYTGGSGELLVHPALTFDGASAVTVPNLTTTGSLLVSTTGSVNGGLTAGSLLVTTNAAIDGNLTLTGNAVITGTVTNAPLTTKAMQAVAVEYATAVATGTGKAYMIVPPSLDGKSVNFVNITTLIEGTTNTNGVQLTRIRGGSAVSVLSTLVSIDSGETSSATAATPYVINGSNDDLATGDILRVDVSNVTTSAATGLIFTLEAN